jgi:multiple sugar transport system substrate-binding protein
VSDELVARPEDYEDVGLDPALGEASLYGRKDFLFNSAKLLAAAAAAGPFFMATKQAAAAEAASTSMAADPIATSAAVAAKKLGVDKLNKTNESGLQALDDKNFTGPLWEKLTGTEIGVTEAPFPQLYSKAIQQHLAKSSALDVFEASPVWIPDLADRGVIVPIDAWIRKYKAQSTLNDYHPLYRSLMKYKGKTWGFFDDGDVWALYYRKDIFGNAALKRAYKAKFKRDLRVPRTWPEFQETAQFITDQMAPKVYGTGMGRALGNPGNQFYFFQQFRANGGEFFNPATMKAQINNAIGVKTMTQILAQNHASPPGVEKLSFVDGWVLWLQGKTAMMMAWPPTGRISENYAQRDKAFSFLPKSKIVGKVGYQLIPQLNGEHAGSFVKTVAADGKNQEAAYLFTQWATSPSISLQRVQLPYTLRDPYRVSHYRSKQFWKAWPTAKQYLATLAEAANNAVLDPIMTGAADYANALDRSMTAIYAGKSPKSGLDEAAAEWDRITDKIGKDNARKSYANFLKLPGATSKNTVAKKGLAVHQ